MAFPAGCYPKSQKPLSAPFVGVLEAFAPDHAWSHRRALVTVPESLTLMQVRRTSDDTPMDVTYGPDGEAGIAGLLSFIGSSSGAVATLKDQVGSADFIQPTADYQRIIVDAGTLVTVGSKAASRGKRYVMSDPDGGGISASTTYSGSVMSVFIRARVDALTGDAFSGIMAPIFAAANGSTISGQGQFVMWVGPSNAGMTLVGNDTYWAYQQPYTTDFLASIIFDGTNVTYRDGTYTYTAACSRAFNMDRFLIGCVAESNQQNGAGQVKVQELAVWLSDQTANEAAIRSAMLA